MILRTRTVLRGGFTLAAVVLALTGAAARLAARADANPLIEAAKRGDVTAARALLKSGADARAIEADGTTALHWAAAGGEAELAGLLLGAGARPAAVNRYGVAPLSLAAETGSAPVIGLLLKAGADPNTASPGGETVLMTAARSGHPDALRALLVRGAAVNAREHTRGQTALMWAAAEGHAEAVAILVEAGADLRARSNGPAVSPESDNVTQVSGYRNYTRKGRIDALTPFMFAVRAGRIAAARALLRAGTDVNETLEDGTSALVLATLNAHYELAVALLEHGADPNAAKQGWTALHQVARMRTLNVGEFPPPPPTGRLGTLDLAKALVARGADVNARMTVVDWKDGWKGGMVNKTGATPLLLAAKGVDHPLMRLLLANGADATLTMPNGTNVLMLTAGIELGQLGIHSGTAPDALEATTLAMGLGLDVNAANANNETALHGAASRGAIDIIRLLVDRGARLDVVSKRGCTALRTANGETGCGAGYRPEARELLRTLMVERGLPADLRSDDELYSFGVGAN